MTSIIDDEMIEAATKACGSERCARAALEAVAPMIGAKLVKDVSAYLAVPWGWDKESTERANHCINTLAARIRELTGAKP